MSAAIERFIAITALIVGLSHLFRAHDWATVYGRLHALGRPGAFLNGGLHLTASAAIVSTVHSFTWPDAVLSVLGCLFVVKGANQLPAPRRRIEVNESRR